MERDIFGALAGGIDTSGPEFQVAPRPRPAYNMPTAPSPQPASTPYSVNGVTYPQYPSYQDWASQIYTTPIRYTTDPVPGASDPNYAGQAWGSITPAEFDIAPNLPGLQQMLGQIPSYRQQVAEQEAAAPYQQYLDQVRIPARMSFNEQLAAVNAGTAVPGGAAPGAGAPAPAAPAPAAPAGGLGGGGGQFTSGFPEWTGDYFKQLWNPATSPWQG